MGKKTRIYYLVTIADFPYKIWKRFDNLPLYVSTDSTTSNAVMVNNTSVLQRSNRLF